MRKAQKSLKKTKFFKKSALIKPSNQKSITKHATILIDSKTKKNQFQIDFLQTLYTVRSNRHPEDQYTEQQSSLFVIDCGNCESNTEQFQ